MIELPKAETGGMESLFPKYLDGKQYMWTAHDIDTVMRCQRLYRLKNLEGWSWDGWGAATSWGKAVHYVVEVFDTMVYYGTSKEEALDIAIVALVENYGVELSASEDNARNLESAIRAIVWRADSFYDNQLKTAPLPDGKPALEVEFEVPIPNLEGHRFRGKMDRIGEMDGEMYLIDLKTTKSQLTKRFFNYYFPNNQVMAYLWVAKKILELPCAGFIIDGVQTGANFTRFARHIVAVSNEQLDEWEYSMVDAINRTVANYERCHFPVNFSSCGDKGGCMFIDVCSVPPAQRLAMLEDDFVLKPHREMDIEYTETEYEDG